MKAAQYNNYLLWVLLAILAFNYVDRFALGILLQSIKTDLRLSDTELGLLTGIAFAMFYSTMGIPIARWADRGNRVHIIALTTALWSIAVALCGFAKDFSQLLLIRSGVAVGEAGCLPPAHSLIADHFSRSERPRAVARYMLGVPASMVIGYLLAGWLNERYGWRATFVLLGIPGLAVAVLAAMTLREPRLKAENSPRGSQPTLREVAATLWSNTTFVHVFLCFIVYCFAGQGISQWRPSFFVRSFGLSSGQLGTWFAMISGLGGLLGTYIGGEWASRYASRNERLQLKVMAVAFCAFAVMSGCIYLSPNRYMAFGFMTLADVGVNMTIGPLFATVQTLVPGRMRAMSIAIIYLFANLVGMGLGPLTVGALSDALQPVLGLESLRYSLLILCPGYLWAAWHLLRASKTVARDLTGGRDEEVAKFGRDESEGGVELTSERLICLNNDGGNSNSSSRPRSVTK